MTVEAATLGYKEVSRPAWVVDRVAPRSHSVTVLVSWISLIDRHVRVSIEGGVSVVHVASLATFVRSVAQR